MTVAPTPLFSTPDVETQSRRRLLLISYHFPPHTAIGGRRWEKLALFVAERGWGLDVISAHDPAVSLANDTRLRALPNGVRLYGAGTLVPLTTDRIENWIANKTRRVRQSRASKANGEESSSTSGSSHSAALATPPSDDGWRATEKVAWNLGSPRGWLRLYWTRIEEARYRRWNAQAERIGLGIARPETHLAVIVSGPPNMTYEAGYQVSKKTGIPFVMDMRDPWAQADRLPEPMATPYAIQLMQRRERAAVEQAVLVAANTDVARESLVHSYPNRASDFITVMNGADDTPMPQSRRMERFSLAHAGSIYRERDIRHLFFAVRRLVGERNLTPEQFGVDFIGYPEGRGSFSLRALSDEIGIGPYVSVGPAVSHAEALGFMAESAMLLVMSGLDMAIPAKLFEYVRFNAWLLAMAVPESALARALDTSGADVVAPTDVDKMVRSLGTRYDEHRQGIVPPQLNAAGRFSRRQHAYRILDAIEQIQRSVV